MNCGPDDRSNLEQIALRVTVTTDAYDVAIDTLWQFEPDAISEQTGPGGTVVLVAGFAGAGSAREAAKALEPLGVRLVAGDDGDWVQHWRAGEPSHLVGPFHLCLPEHTTDAAQGVLTLTIEPSTTFGFSHASTRLALALLAEVTSPGLSVADIGCGSGVLGIAAARLGAHCVDAVDIDPHAIEVTVGNAQRNGVDVRARVGSTEALPAQHYELILLNVTAATSSALAGAIVDTMAPGGQLIVSGLLASQRALVLQAFSPLTLRGETAENDWTALHLARPPT